MLKFLQQISSMLGLLLLAISSARAAMAEQLGYIELFIISLSFLILGMIFKGAMDEQNRKKASALSE
jgi:hypothetical protein